MSGDEIRYVQEAFETNWIAPAGNNIDSFENELASYCGASYAVATITGTAAIHLALVMLGVGTGDEVICSSFTFAASCSPILYQGATPVLIDSEKDSWNMDPAYLEEAIKDRIQKGKKPKAIILVHVYGMPAKLAEIIAIARQNDIPVIEDAAEAFGSLYSDKKVGTFGDIGIFSFNGNKIITTSGGGALITENKDWMDEARYLSNQALEKIPYDEHKRIGYTYRLSNICAGIGRGQLKVIDQRVQQRRAIFDFYKEALSSHQGISFQPEPEGSHSNRWLTCIQLDPEKCNGISPDELRLSLEDRNIESRPLWKPMHLQPAFNEFPFYGGTVSQEIFERGLALPSGTAMNIKALAEVTRIVEGSLEVDSME
jgi:dTDP-4-amino-4,6-dideoxygalactose transaminase